MEGTQLAESEGWEAQGMWLVPQEAHRFNEAQKTFPSGFSKRPSPRQIIILLSAEQQPHGPGGDNI